MPDFPPPVFVISLKGSDKRRALMTEKLGTLGLPFEFFDAVDGRNLTDVASHPEYDAPRRLRSFGRNLTGGEIGCLLSHKHLYKKMVDENIPAALILEDDTVLAPEFPEALKALTVCPAPFDIVRFLGSPKVAKGKHRKIYPLGKNYYLVRLKATPGGAHCTFMTQSGAKKMLKHLVKSAFPIDMLLGRAWETGAEVLSVQPGLATQDLALQSAIGDDRFDEKNELTGFSRLIYPLTRAAFKCTETLGKRYIYYGNALKDSRYR